MGPLCSQGAQIPMEKRLKSFVHAWNGLREVVSGQANFRIHLAVAVVVVAAGFQAGLTAGEWCIIVLAIFLVLSLEAANTAIEHVVDLLSPGYHETARKAKDIGAAAVLLAAVGSIAAGLLIFLPKIL